MQKYIFSSILLALVGVGVYIGVLVSKDDNNSSEPDSLAGRIYADIQYSHVGKARVRKTKQFDSCSTESQQSLEAWLVFRSIYNKYRYELTSIARSDVLNQTRKFLPLIEEMQQSQIIYVQRLVKDLISYKKKVDAIDNKAAVFDHALTINNSNTILQYLYQSGFEQTDSWCLKEVGFPRYFAQVNMESLSYSDTSFESWAYTFWLRRYNEQLEDKTYSLLILIDSLIERLSIIESKKSIYWHVSELSSSYQIRPENEVLVEFYNQLIIGRSINNTASENMLKIWVDKLEHGPEMLPFYRIMPFKDKDLLTLESINEGESEGDNETGIMLSIPYYTYVSGENLKSEVNFITNDPDLYINNQMLVVELSKNKVELVQKFIDENYQTEWYLKQEGSEIISCPKNYDIRQIEGGSQEYFIVQRECFGAIESEYLTGMSLILVLENQKLEGDGGDQLIEKNAIFYQGEKVTIKSDFIADVDNDGLLEVILNFASGSGDGSSDSLVELDNGHWQLLRVLSAYSNSERLEDFEVTNNRKQILARLEFIDNISGYDNLELKDYSGGIYYYDRSRYEEVEPEVEVEENIFERIFYSLNYVYDSLSEIIKDFFGIEDEYKGFIL
jgi:hypothetical protein